MKRNKLYIIGAVVLVLLLAVGCGKKDKETESGDSSTGLKVEQNAEDSESGDNGTFSETSPEENQQSSESNQNNNNSNNNNSNNSGITSEPGDESDSGKKSDTDNSEPLSEWGPIL